VSAREKAIHAEIEAALKAAGLEVVIYRARDIVDRSRNARAIEIADRVVPEYRNTASGAPSYSCSGHTAKRWEAAFDGARLALGAEE